MGVERGQVKTSTRAKHELGELDFRAGLRANSSETAEYLAQMASELVLLARSAKLERLSVLLDLVRREAEAEAI
jgi:hypothetical protein